MWRGAIWHVCIYINRKLCTLELLPLSHFYPPTIKSKVSLVHHPVRRSLLMRGLWYLMCIPNNYKHICTYLIMVLCYYILYLITHWGKDLIIIKLQLTDNTTFSSNVFQRQFATSYKVTHFVNDLIRWIQNYLHKKVTFNSLRYTFLSGRGWGTLSWDITNCH